MKLINEIAYEKDLNHFKAVIADGVKGLKSKPFKKKFSNYKELEKWFDSDAADDVEILRIYNESVDHIGKMISAASTENAVNFNKHFEAEVNTRVAEMINDRRPEIVSSAFGISDE